jgi:hypothetical protein
MRLLPTEGTHGSMATFSRAELTAWLCCLSRQKLIRIGVTLRGWEARTAHHGGPVLRFACSMAAFNQCTLATTASSSWGQLECMWAISMSK